ncbi:MAG: fibronectin type III domain-containing protein [Candidatus Aminicenantes bacterium]|nr:fibronectin type III domain-containing protein [Candidatus Aminicenantes bacterium]
MNNRVIVLLSFILLFIFSGTVGSIHGAIPQKEREALIALYNNTDGDNWRDSFGGLNNSGWKTPPLHSDGFAKPGTEKDWYGVTCDEGNTMVVRIDLNGNNLTGTIPPELGNLSNLQYLYITSSQLTGLIPMELSKLSALTELGLNNNQLTGTIPPELANLSNLKTLNLNKNQLKEYIPSALGNLSALTYLDLHSNQLSGPIPPELGNLSALIVLVLSFNQLTGPIPPQLSQLSQLQWLQLDSNLLSGPIPSELGQLLQLQWLSLAFNQLTGIISPELGKLSKLQWLQLDSNQLSGPIPPQLGQLSQLQLLSLGFNQLTDAIPPELGQLSKLDELFLSVNQLTGSIPPALGNLSALNELNLASNQLTGSIPQEMEKLVGLSEYSSDFRWNGLYTDYESLRGFLNKKQNGGNWESTQTIAPEKIAARVISTTSIEVSWEPITYTGDEGGYRIFYSLTPGGPYTLFNTTKTKTDFRLEITGLIPFTKYYFVVQTWTEPHETNLNKVDSEYSAEVSEETQEAYKTISGRVTTDETSNGIAGVTLFFSPSNQLEVTDISGNYSHVVNMYWSGTVTPSKTGYIFEPEQETFENVISDKSGINFIAKLIPLSLSGKVISGDEGIEGVILTFIADSGETKTEITNADGSYSHQVYNGWIGRATPSKEDLLFYPPFIDYGWPGVRGYRDHQDYQLSISLTLQITRKQDNTLIFRKEYGEIVLNVGLIGVSTAAIQKFIILRKEPGNSFQLNKEFVVQGQQNSFQFTYRDEYLEKGKTYTYIARAIDAQGKIIGESGEKTI